MFYLKGVAPPEVTTRHLYTGILPFIIIQLLVLCGSVFSGGIVMAIGGGVGLNV
ncbi:MAG: hypothetical protein R2795_15405 [Saprospiraceae bacterium]